MEIELKYLIKNQNTAEEIFSDPLIKRITDENSKEVNPMNAIYFDTEDRALRKEKIAFRVRREGKRIVATAKWNDVYEDGKFEREEVNIPVSDESMLISPNVEIFKDSPIYDKIFEIVGKKSLSPLVTMDFIRTQVRLDYDETIIELSVDRGEIKGREGSEPIFELELELYSGEEGKLVELGNILAEKFSLVYGSESKYKRGLKLIGE